MQFRATAHAGRESQALAVRNVVLRKRTCSLPRKCIPDFFAPARDTQRPFEPWAEGMMRDYARAVFDCRASCLPAGLSW